MPGSRPTLTQRLFLRVGGVAGLLVLMTVAAIGFRDDADERDRLLRAVAAAVVLAVVLLVIGALALRKVVIRPVRRLSSDVAKVVEGAFDHPIHGDGSRELAELSQSVTRMRDRILSERDHARRADDAVDQQAPAVAALRTLLAPRLAACPPELDAAGALVPADGTLAGDWFDIAARPNGIVVAIGDVCGHGIDAGMLAVRTKFALLDAIDLGLHPEAALELASSRFGRDDTFATAMVAEVDLLAGTCRYASAGHTPLLLVRSDGTVERLERTGPLIGLAHGPRPNASVALQPGDTLVLYTDGVVEARPRGGTQFLEARLLALRNEGTGQGAGAVTEAILAAVVSHCAGVCPDDATIAVIRVNGAARRGAHGLSPGSSTQMGLRARARHRRRPAPPILGQRATRAGRGPRSSRPSRPR